MLAGALLFVAQGMALPAVIFVGESQQWIPELVARAAKLRAGPGDDPASDIGPVVTKESLDRMLRIISEGISFA